MVTKIIATGSYLPSKIVTNDDLANRIDTSDEWIRTRTGIRQRHIAADQELTSDLAVIAVQNALGTAGITVDSLDGIIVATATPDYIFPATAATVQGKLGLKNGFAFDINAVCSGFLYAYVLADSLIRTGQAKRVAVIGSETMSRVLDWNDRATCVLFGDGAGVVILEATENAAGIIASEICADGALGNILNVPGGVSAGNLDAKVCMHGKEVFRYAVEKMAASIAKMLNQASLNVEDVDWVVPHQANIRILDAVGEKLGISKDKIVITLDQHANTSAASIPLALDLLNKQKLLKSGKKIVLAAAGAGFTWGSIILSV